jgi:hypothetical protein
VLRPLFSERTKEVSCFADPESLFFALPLSTNVFSPLSRTSQMLLRNRDMSPEAGRNNRHLVAPRVDLESKETFKR